MITLTNPRATTAVCCLLSATAWGSRIAGDNFENGMLAKPLWVDKAWVGVTNVQACSGKWSAGFHFRGSKDPTKDTTAELRFDLGKAYRDLWFSYSLYIPKNYHLRNGKNNKFFRLWGTDYSDPEKIGASTYGNRPFDGFALLTCEWNATGGGMGEAGSKCANFIAAGDLGTWMRIMVHVEAATPDVKGTLQIWKNGDLIIDNTHKMDLYKDGGVHAYRYGYLLGWANTGFDEDVDLYIDDVLFGTTQSDVVVAKAANCANPDYVYCEDFESGREQTGALPPFSISGRHGVRAGAGYKSSYGYSNVLVENNGLPPYPEVRFPRQDGIVFVHYMVKVPALFYLGRANHGYYLFDSQERATWGSAVMDHATDHPAWLDPEWDPMTIHVLRGSGYHRILRSFEGFEPGRRGEWHSYQVMVVPSEKDPSVGRMKVWVDGVLANFCKHDTIPAMDTFWISNYWHSHEYVPKDTVSNLFESFTAPPHPAFEIQLDNLIVSKQFIEFGPNRPQVERVRFGALQADAFTVHFDTTVPATGVSVAWGPQAGVGRGEWQETAKTASHAATAQGYFHALTVEGLEPDTSYALVVSAVDAKGRRFDSAPTRFTSRRGTHPAFEMDDGTNSGTASWEGPWRGEIFPNYDFTGVPVCVRRFDSLSFVSWPGVDADDLIDTSKPMAVRYTKEAVCAAGDYTFRVEAYDGVRVTVDGKAVVDAVAPTHGHWRPRDVRVALAEGRHQVVVEHTLWREAKDWNREASKYLAFKIVGSDPQKPPACLSQAIYNTRFHTPDEPMYCGRWSTEIEATLEFGETEAYGQSAKGWGRYPSIPFGKLVPGKTYHWRVTAADRLGNRTVTPDAVFVCGDTIAPRKILCRLERTSETALTLRFGAPGEDGRHGTAAAYDVRWSTEPLTVRNWAQATRVLGVPPPQPSGSDEAIPLEGFPRGKTYHVAVQAIDAAGQTSLLSNGVSDPPGPEVMDCDGDGFGVGSMKGDDPDDYDDAVPGPPNNPADPSTWGAP